MNFDVLSGVLGLETPCNFSSLVKRSLYSASLKTFAFELSDGAAFSQKGDTHFGFLVPVPAESGTALVRQLISQQVITAHFALSVLAVDVANPVYSPSRAALWEYVPTDDVRGGAADLADRTAQAILSAALSTALDSPERQFVGNWQMAPDQLRLVVQSRIKDYLGAVLARLGSQDAVDDYTRLAESRRRRFARTPLDEFPLLLSRTNLPSDLDLRMSLDGTLQP
jgi:hypothetical protein